MDLVKFEEWLRLNYDTKNTIDNYLFYTKQFFQSFPEMNQENLNGYLTKRLEEGVKKSTFNKIVYSLMPYVKYLKLTLEFPRPKKVNIAIQEHLTIEELEKDIIPNLDKCFRDNRKYELILKFMFFTGLRIREMLNIEVDDINFEKKIIKIKNTKGKVDREIYSLDAQLFKDLAIHVKCNAVKKVFDISYDSVEGALKKIQEELKLDKKLNPHMFRHSFAQYCVRIGVNAFIIQKLMGHKDIKTTLRYCSPGRTTVQEACEKLERK